MVQAVNPQDVREAWGERGVRSAFNPWLPVRVLLATLWAGLLVLAGLELAFHLGERLPGSGRLGVVAGITSAAMGQFVFATLVADRLVPRAWAPVRLSVQVISGAVYVVGLILLVMMLLGVLRR
jgi:hypothetical protein